jgi:hypothetical protein
MIRRFRIEDQPHGLKFPEELSPYGAAFPGAALWADASKVTE